MIVTDKREARALTSREGTRARDISRDLRPTGLPYVEGLRWGNRLHVFHETKEDFLDVLAAFFRAGLEANELCILVRPEWLTEEELHDHLAQKIPDLDEHLDSGRLTFRPMVNWFETEKIPIGRIKTYWHERIQYALEHGFAGVRGSGDTFWMDKINRTEFLHFEAEIEAAFGGSRMVGLRTFPLTRLHAHNVLDIIRAHPFTLALRNGERQIVEAPEPKLSSIGGTAAQPARDADPLARLTAREREVLQRVVKGASYKQIANELQISRRTVEVYRNRIFQKTGARNSAELIRMAVTAENNHKKN